MARNGSGTYTKVNTFVAGNTITASGHNQNWDDIATEITNSVAADGQTTMTAPLKHSSGTFAAPSVTFGVDTDTGVYRNAANEIGFAAGGAIVATFGTATAFFGGAVAISGGAIFTSGFIASATANFTLGFIASATASFSTGFIASATCTFAGVILASATAVFTTRPIAAGTSIVVRGDLADQTIQETATSITNFVVPGRQQHHPSAAKAWAFVTISGGTPSLSASYNVTSLTDNGVGNTTLNLTVSFSSGNFCAVATMLNTTLNQGYMIEVTALGTGSIQVRTGSLGVSGANTTFAAADISFFVAAYGDQ